VAPRVVVRSLEYNIADGAIANMARALGRTHDEQRARTWSQSYKTLWDANLGVFRGRNADGSWFGPSDEFNNNGDVYYGANAIQYSWLAPHDMFGLLALHGSRDTFIGRLTRFFEEAKKQLDAGQGSRFYTHNDEPDVHAMYLFLAGGRPDLTQRWVEWASQQFYGTGRDGLSGNEDAGTLSAWYALSAIGLYPVTATDVWLIGRPAFPRIALAVGSAKLVIEAPDASPERPYVRSVTLDGQPLVHPWLRHEQIANGGHLRFEMSAEPQEWGNEFGSF
jgi:predicted alpha-1,2-mannosidase